MQADIIIVGGGAGGLELACKLGRALGPGKVALVDARLTHIWKPSLHEVAAGTLDLHQEGLSYQMLAHDNSFSFVYGPLTALDAPGRSLTVGPVADADGAPVLPQRQLAFGALVIAVGSTSNYFGVPGALEHTISLNAPEDAERFRLRLLAQLAQPEKGALEIVIIGAGATGVELAAELREASAVYAAYGVAPQRALHITLLEGGPRILGPLPERVAGAALRLLQERGVSVVTDCRVTAIEAHQVRDGAGGVYPASLCVWAAGIRAPALLAQLGLPLAKGGQLQVDGQLRVTGCAHIYALGDCAASVGADGKLVPPRAQAAHQQADFLYRRLRQLARGKAAPVADYRYVDYGSLVSFGHRNTVGSLMGSLKGVNFFIDGLFARMMYVSLHLMHHAAVLGVLRTGVLALARFLIRRSTPLVKLH